MKNPTEENHWQDFFGTLKERLRKPCKHPTFVMYFLIIIVVVGGFGLFEPMVRYWILGMLSETEFPRALVSAAYTYFVAIAATAAVDLILADRQRKFLLMFFMLCSVLVVLCATFAAILGTVLGKPRAATLPSVAGYVLALLLWWVGNANNAHLLDTPLEPTAPTGGDAQAKPSGDLSGFRV